MPKCLGPKRLGPKRLGAEASRGRNGLVPKRLVTGRVDLILKRLEPVRCAALSDVVRNLHVSVLSVQSQHISG